MNSDEEKFGRLMEELSGIQMVALLDWGLDVRLVREGLAFQLAILDKEIDGEKQASEQSQ